MPKYTRIVLKLSGEVLAGGSSFGIDPDRVPELLAGAGGGIGLSNVDARLRATFGERYALRIESELGHGTTAVMTVPNLLGDHAARDAMMAVRA